MLYIFIFLHQTTTLPMLKTSPKLLYIFIFLHQTTTLHTDSPKSAMLYIFIFLHQTTTSPLNSSMPHVLYIFIFLHQTTTVGAAAPRPQGCISLYSYIKPQRLNKCLPLGSVVYLYIPTSNHNSSFTAWLLVELYIFIFLHQTTTIRYTHFRR